MLKKTNFQFLVIAALSLLILSLLPLSISLAQDPPTISIANISGQDEGNTGDLTIFEFTLTRTGVITSESTVDYETLDFTATVADNDFVAASGTVTFPANDPSDQVIQITVNGDNMVESDELFQVELSNPVNATLAQSLASAIITNDDAAPGIVITPSVVNLTEGNATTVEFTLTSAPTDNVTINLSTGAECSVVPTTVTLTPANFATGVDVTITAIEDTDVEGNQICVVTTAPATSNDPQYNTINPADITVNITDDDSNASAGTTTPLATFTPLPTLTPLPTATPTPPVPQDASVTEVGGLAVRTGPYLGATLMGVAFPGFQYPILARSNDEGGPYTWFLLQFDGFTGWVSGRFLTFIGLEGLLPGSGSLFDGLDNAPDINVYGTTFAITDMRRRPSGRSAIVGTIPANATVSIVGRTRQNGGDFWYQVRYNGLMGWVPAFVNRGNTSAVPIR